MTDDSIMFQWNCDEIETYIRGKMKLEEIIEPLKLAEKLRENLGREPKILEAGSGNGCVVVLFDRLGYKNIQGVELNGDTVNTLNKIYPNLKISQGSILDLDNHLLNNDLVLSLGVIEHFPDGLEKPMKAMYDAVAEGGYASISVPCLNLCRWFLKFKDKKTKKFMKSGNYKYQVWLLDGKFYEYHLTPRQFRNECKKVGFEIVKHVQGELELGIMHILNPSNEVGKYIWHKDFETFYFSFLGKVIYKIAKFIPFLAGHFQICVCHKPISSNKD